jgi:hypothetical protein
MRILEAENECKAENGQPVQQYEKKKIMAGSPKIWISKAVKLCVLPWPYSLRRN